MVCVVANLLCSTTLTVRCRTPFTFRWVCFPCIRYKWVMLVCPILGQDRSVSILLYLLCEKFHSLILNSFSLSFLLSWSRESHLFCCLSPCSFCDSSFHVGMGYCSSEDWVDLSFAASATVLFVTCNTNMSRKLAEVYSLNFYFLDYTKYRESTGIALVQKNQSRDFDESPHFEVC